MNFDTTTNTDTQDTNAKRAATRNLTLVPPAVPQNADELDKQLTVKRTINLNDAVQPIFRNLWDTSDHFRALNTGVNNATAVNKRLDFDDYEVALMIKQEAAAIGQSLVAQASAGDIRSAVLVVRNRYQLGRNHRKAQAVETALLTQQAAE